MEVKNDIRMKVRELKEYVIKNTVIYNHKINGISNSSEENYEILRLIKQVEDCIYKENENDKY